MTTTRNSDVLIKRSSVAAIDNAIVDMVGALSPIQKKSLQRFVSGAMSFGSIGYEAHTTIASALNQIAMAIHGVDSIEALNQLPYTARPMSNSGEGGELESRNNTLFQSRIRQVASGRFGVNIAYLANASELQIKINQGAKPGIGGELPGHKVNDLIAKTRLTEPGITLASPPPHHDIYSIEDLKQLVHDLRSANPKASISVKLAASADLGVIAAGVAKCGVDNISIAGPGGTGAAPLTAKYEFVHPWESSLAEVHQTLTREGMRSSVSLTVSGGLQTGLDFFKALLLGADFIEGGTSVLVSLGCVMAEVCHEGTCPTGIATTNQAIIDKKFKGTPEDVATLLIESAKSLSTYLEKYGFVDPAQAVGRTDLLRVKDDTRLTQLDSLLEPAQNPYVSFGKLRKVEGSSYIEQMSIARILQGETNLELLASNRDLSFGARIAYHTTLAAFKQAWSKPVRIHFKGLAVGQSFGFVAPTNLVLSAMNSNDGTGKSLDGATLYIQQCVGNQAAFGATRGKLMARFLGDRAAVRNSGATIVAESLGQMAANFMTGGSLTILATPKYYPNVCFKTTYVPPVLFREDVIGPNIGAGLSGGKIYLPKTLYAELDASNYLSPHARYMQASTLEEEELAVLTQNIKEYAEHIDSDWVDELIQNSDLKNDFVKLDPKLPKREIVKPKVQEISKPVRSVPLTSNAASKVMTYEKEALDFSLSSLPVPESESEQPKDACGVGTLVRLDGQASRELSTKVLSMLARLMHRGAVGIDPNTGDGCGVAWYGLDGFFQKQFPALRLRKNEYAVIPMMLDPDAVAQEAVLISFKTLLAQENLSIAGSRDVLKQTDLLGYIGKQQEFLVKQFVVLKPDALSIVDFEKSLVRLRLRFELMTQLRQDKVRPHIYSASAYHVIYKSLVKEDKFADYFLDFLDPDFKASAGVAHSRFTTNTFPRVWNIQPLSKVANNGENNALRLIMRWLSHDVVLKQLLGLDKIDLKGLSDSHIMSIYMDMLHLLNFSVEEIVTSTIQRYHPKDNVESQFYNLFAIPFEGPNASMVMMEDKIVIVRDINGFRPQRGVLNDEFLYCGSELGTVDISGDVLDLTPGQALVINLASGKASIYRPDHAAFFLDNLHSIPENTNLDSEFNSLGLKNIALRRLRAGWNTEFDKMIMEPLYQGGKGSASSMADQGPIESLVSGSHVTLANFFKGSFSQVTNPALAKKEEEAYMSTRTFVGRKHGLANLGTVAPQGFLLNSPIVDNDQLEHLRTATVLKAKIIDTIFLEKQREDGLKTALEQITNACIREVRNGVTLLILSDCKSNTKFAAIPPVLIASIVDQALLQEGLRAQVSLALQSGSLLAGRDVAQAISIGGVDIVNPYLAFIPDTEELAKRPDFKKRSQVYKESLRQELLGFMARMGISTVTAYRGTKGFNAYGLDANIAALFGVHSQFGGLDFQGVTQIIRYNHNFLKNEGMGKYLWQGQAPRTKIWNPSITNAAIQSARGKVSLWSQVESQADYLKRGAPRGSLRLVQPQIWTRENPMTVCIMGGGAAGFYQARALLDSNLPVKIVIIEQKHGNKFGLVGDGIAPDHESTKRQALLLQECLEDPRVQYFGGVEIGKTVTYEELERLYPCIIDCRGATEDIQLDVPGASIPGILYASKVYKAYNQEFNPFAQNEWPLRTKSKNPAIGIIGNGNVTADLARLFLRDVASLEATSINPQFLRYLNEEGPDLVRIFARGQPTDCKIGLKELKEFEELGIWISSSFDPNLVPLDNLSEHQQKLYDFFLKIHEREIPVHHTKRLHFHFQMQTKEFIQRNSEIEAVFLDKNNEIQTFRSRNYIVAIGKQPLANNQHVPYVSGWAAGNGGTLRSAEESAYKTMLKIREDFHAGIFHHRMDPAQEQEWQLSSVSKYEFMSILAWLQNGKPLATVDDFIKAKRFQVATSSPVQVSEPVVSTQIPVSRVAADPQGVIICDASGSSHKLAAGTTGTLLEYLKRTAPSQVPRHECDGALVCGTCVVDIEARPPGLHMSNKEMSLLKINKFNPNTHVLACAHRVDDAELLGGVFRLK